MQTNLKTKDQDIMTHVKDIVVASLYKSPSTDISGLIKDVYKTLTTLDEVPAKPKLNWKDTIHPDYLICLEDGVELKFITRHIRSHYNLTPEQYREKWGLPLDYPMTCPNYSLRRSEIAKQCKLGFKK